MSNIISAILNLVQNPKINLIRTGDSRNRANNMGGALEEYIKDLFADTVEENDPITRNAILSTTFSYLGNQNNPPDSMLFSGDAIEVKKIENRDSALALNSSYPKAKLYANSPMISRACRECESWTEKDIIYAVGVVDGNRLTSLAFVYGEDYCASKETYEKVVTDPLDVASVDLSKMIWKIKNPFKAFDYVYKPECFKEFDFMCIITEEKYHSFPNFMDLEILNSKTNNLQIKNVKIKTPNNPSLLKSAKLITYCKGAE